jgi:hypothetical protein
MQNYHLEVETCNRRYKKILAQDDILKWRKSEENFQNWQGEKHLQWGIGGFGIKYLMMKFRFSHKRFRIRMQPSGISRPFYFEVAKLMINDYQYYNQNPASVSKSHLKAE